MRFTSRRYYTASRAAFAPPAERFYIRRDAVLARFHSLYERNAGFHKNGPQCPFILLPVKNIPYLRSFYSLSLSLSLNVAAGYASLPLRGRK
jgi:hypothetical protein